MTDIIAGKSNFALRASEDKRRQVVEGPAQFNTIDHPFRSDMADHLHSR
ncbi:MAG: hypothetical protein JRJ60_12740, partial [Deltaproteobacteria bacterium]|nr:hypothetical protein [Deltaproteobacteria bacterium]